MVDVLVLNYNDAGAVANFVQHIAGYHTVRRILIVDNCSTDDSMDKLSGCLNDKTELISSGRNGGYGYGNNVGIRYLKEKYDSEYILLSNPDVVVSEGTIEAMETFLRENDDYALAAPLMVDANDVPQYNTALKVVSKAQYILSLDLLYSKFVRPFYYKNMEQEDAEVKTVDGVSGSMFLMNADKMLRYGMFDENLFLFGEEIVLSLLMQRAGLKTGLLLKEKFIHMHSVSIEKSYKGLVPQRKLLMRSHLYILKKYYGVKGIEYGLAWLLSKISIVEVWVVSILFRKKYK